MHQSKYTDNQLLALLKHNENSSAVQELCREHSVSSAQFYKWQGKYCGMDACLMKHIKELEEENKPLEKIYAEERLKVEIRQEVLEGKF